MASLQRRLVVLVAVAGLISSLFVAVPTAAVAADPASLTVTATYTQGHAKGQNVTMQGNSPGATGCEPTSACNQLRATFRATGIACPTSWPFESSPTPVVPTHQGNITAGPYSKAFSIWADSHPQLNEPSKYHLCSYLVDATTAENATLASADTPLGTPSVGSASLTIAAEGPSSAADSGTISVDLSGTTSSPAQVLVQALDDGKPCGGNYTGNYNQQFALAYDDVQAGNFAVALEVKPQEQDATGRSRPGYYKLCAYLNPFDTMGPPSQTPAATASMDHVITSVACPSSTFSIEDPQQQVKFWVQGQGHDPNGEAGLATTHVTIPGPGTVIVTPKDESASESGGAASRHYSKGGRYGVDILAYSWEDTFRGLYESQQSETIQYVATYTPDFEGSSCVQSDMTTFVLKEDFKGIRNTSVDWVPAKTKTTGCFDYGCPLAVTAGCYTVEIPCYERTMTLQATRKRLSGTIKETGGGSHCWGSGQKFSWVYLWQFKQGAWVYFTQVKASNGTFSASLGGVKRGTFQATIFRDDYSHKDYTCGVVLSNVKKLPPA